MKVLKAGQSADDIDMYIEDWQETYSFMPYGSTLAFYPKSKATHDGPFAPKAGETCRFSFHFLTNEMAEAAFKELEKGRATFKDYMEFWDGKPEYRDCI